MQYDAYYNSRYRDGLYYPHQASTSPYATAQAYTATATPSYAATPVILPQHHYRQPVIGNYQNRLHAQNNIYAYLGESRVEYVPVERRIIEYQPQEKVFTDYVPIEYQQVYYPRITYERVRDYIPVERLQERVEYDVYEHQIQRTPYASYYNRPPVWNTPPPSSYGYQSPKRTFNSTQASSVGYSAQRFNQFESTLKDHEKGDTGKKGAKQSEK